MRFQLVGVLESIETSSFHDDFFPTYFLLLFPSVPCFSYLLWLTVLPRGRWLSSVPIQHHHHFPPTYRSLVVVSHQLWLLVLDGFPIMWWKSIVPPAKPIVIACLSIYFFRVCCVDAGAFLVGRCRGGRPRAIGTQAADSACKATLSNRGLVCAAPFV